MKPLRDMTEGELRILFDDVSREIRRRLPRRTLFVLIAFDSDGIAQYVSNADRRQMIQALRDSAELLQRREDVSR